MNPDRPTTGTCLPANPPTEPSSAAPADRREGGTIKFPVCDHCHQRHHEAARCEVRDSLTSSMGNPPDPSEAGRRVTPAANLDELDATPPVADPSDLPATLLSGRQAARAATLEQLDGEPLGESPPESELSAAWGGTRKERKP